MHQNVVELRVMQPYVKELDVMELDVMELDVMEVDVMEQDVIKVCAEQGNTTTANFVRGLFGWHDASLFETHCFFRGAEPFPGRIDGSPAQSQVCLRARVSSRTEVRARVREHLSLSLFLFACVCVGV